MNGYHGLVWGWHPDPFEMHEERYISVDGVPTKLVRDAGEEAYDPPPVALAPGPTHAGGLTARV